MAPQLPPDPSAERLRSARLAQEIEFLAARSRSIGSAIANRRLGQHGLKVRSYSVLALASDGVGPSQKELADFLRLDPSQIVAIVDELEAAGLVRRDPDPLDRRSRIIAATSAGLARYELASRSARDAEDDALATLSTAERDLLRELLRKTAFADPGGDGASSL